VVSGARIRFKKGKGRKECSCKVAGAKKITYEIAYYEGVISKSGTGTLKAGSERKRTTKKVMDEGIQAGPAGSNFGGWGSWQLNDQGRKASRKGSDVGTQGGEEMRREAN